MQPHLSESASHRQWSTWQDDNQVIFAFYLHSDKQTTRWYLRPLEFDTWAEKSGFRYRQSISLWVQSCSTDGNDVDEKGWCIQYELAKVDAE